MAVMVPIIINPASGRGLSPQRKALIEELAHAQGWHGEIHVLSPDDDVATVVDDYLEKGAHHIVLGGGDGTIATALPPIVDHKATLGILPTGTGNLIALNLGIPRNLPHAMETALNGIPQRVDLGRVNGRYFAVIAGLGWDGAMMRDAHPHLKKRFGLTAYLWAAIKNIAHPRDIYGIRIDGKAAGNYIANTVMLVNMPLIAPRVRVAPDAKPNDGLLDLAIVQTETLLGWVRLCFSALTGNLTKDPGTVFLRGKRIEIFTTSGDRLLQVDGDYYSRSDRVEARILPGKISVMLPRD